MISEQADWQFISTEFLGGPGEAGERRTWESVCRALKQTGQGIGFLNYRTFPRTKAYRWEPDILLLSRDWGLLIIEVKSFELSNLQGIQGNRWSMDGSFYAKTLEPFKQAENQLRQILKQYDRHPEFCRKISSRVFVSLPLITRHEWIDKFGEVDHPVLPPLIFADEFGVVSLRRLLENYGTYQQKASQPVTWTDEQWARMQNILMCPIRKTPEVSPLPHTQNQVKKRSEALNRLKNWVYQADHQQASIGLQIPPGPQRIRGIAGSGKTVLLCQKAAQMHLQHPEWKIALIFFTRSLYDLLPKQLQTWYALWSDGEKLDLNNSNLQVFHAWGSNERQGFYRMLRNVCGQNATVSKKVEGTYPERLALACRRLLESYEIPQMFDAILIDEGQDLVMGETLQYEDKEAIYWLAWEALRPIAPDTPKLKRLIWAYDEAQNLDTLGIPSYGEIFGDELGALLSGSQTGPIYPGGAKKSEVMRRCYRTPGPILTAAHGIGMGLKRYGGMLSGFTTKKDWEKIGYEVQGDFYSGRMLTLHRPSRNSPNPVPQLWSAPLVEFDVFPSRDKQLKAIASKIESNLKDDGLNPHEILVIVIGAAQETIKERGFDSSARLQKAIANVLFNRGINYYLPGANALNTHPHVSKFGQSSSDADQFWHEGGVTTSQIYRAKGHEAPMVYVIGIENLAQDESNMTLRNQLFVAMTRSMAWLNVSGVENPSTGDEYLFYEELREVLKSGATFKFKFRRSPARLLNET